jgi:DNA-binding MarR family transcriptional regulator
MPTTKVPTITFPPGSDYRPDATFRALIRTFGLLRRVQEPFFGRFGISASQWGVLRALHRAELEKLEWLRLTDLGKRLVVRPPSITGVVDRLQRMGLLQRTSLPDDRRAKRVSLTPRGRERVLTVLAAMPAQVESVIGVLALPEREHLQKLLETLEAHMRVLADRHESGADESETNLKRTEPS